MTPPFDRAGERGDLVPGTLELLVLQTLSLQPMHGYGIAQHIERLSGEVFRLGQGSLYPALERLQRKGWVTSEWRATPTRRQARYYTLTPLGREQLDEARTLYERTALAIDRVLNGTLGALPGDAPGEA
jgi:PadR family transcriptional regulator PadR